jgi:hypothetical protein
MSADNQTPVVVETTVIVEKKKKAPSLAAKYSRFMAFGYWFIVNNSELVSEELRDQLFNKLLILGTVEEQTAFYESFEGQLSEVNKTIRKMVAASKKPPKTKTPRAKKAKNALPQDELVAQLIADANNTGVETSQPVVSEKKPKAPRAKKTKEAAPENAGEPQKKPKAPRAKKTKEAAAAEITLAEPSPELVSEAITEPVSEVVSEAINEPVAAVKKPKAPRAKKTKEVEATSEEVSAAAATATAEKPVEKKKKADSEKPKKTKKTKEVVPDSNDRDIQTQFITIDDKEYLIDENNKLYNVEAPHLQVGTYDTEISQVILN